MKKLTIILCITLFGINSFAQTLKPVKIDSLVTVSLPEDYQKKDTLGQQIYSANSAYGYMVVIRAENAKGNTALKKEKDLNKVLKDYIKGIKGQAEGSAQNVRDTTIGHLKAKTFTLQTDQGEGIKLRNFIIIYTQEVTYTFEYFYEEMRKDLVNDEYKAFSSSIKLSPQLQRNDQYLTDAKGLSTGAKVAIFGGGPIIILVIIIAMVRRKKRKQEEEA
ncbi:hypothetical protein [Mucilaginibacter segetis]|uniref:Uncharacterized protein n=1 Tax=Mucilaginibacter segetis TaxID=2793071 RepID=A0A934UN85_9SPHI|nr:hypothetical protein [Mucilaginibacter segetis]MBK0380528.1 hypothetical protein [Mucilaginibacter segetis]